MEAEEQNIISCRKPIQYKVGAYPPKNEGGCRDASTVPLQKKNQKAKFKYTDFLDQ